MNQKDKKRKEKIRLKITTDKRWASRAMQVLYSYQTEEEKETLTANKTNGRGFNKFDAPFFASLVEQLNKRNSLSDAQWRSAFKGLGKYAGQLLSIAKEKEAPDIVY